MGEVEIVTVCAKCETEFDDSDDTINCLFCGEDFCEDCQEEHAQEIIFGEDNEVKNYLENKKSEILKEERARVRKLKK